MPQIHPMAVVESGAELADDVVVGPFAFVGRQVQLGAGCVVHHHASIEGHTIVGEGNEFFPQCVIGALPQPNAEADDWRDFFRDRRLLHMAGAAHAAGRLPAATLRRIERLAGRLDAWDLGGTRPSLVHGDLWGGNVLSRGGRIVGLIDPAIYFADAEIELAFMTLFGTVGDAFFDRYAEHRPLRPGFFEVRRDLYNLYPLLVHVRLFGGHYVGQVERILARFAG